MRIYNGVCKTLEQFQKNCGKFQKALSNEDLVVKFSEHVAHEGASASSSSSLVGRVEPLSRNHCLMKAWEHFVVLNWEFGLRLDPNAITLQMPAEVSIQRVFSDEDKKLLLSRLKTPYVISLKTNDLASINAHLALLPPFFHAASRFSSSLKLDIDSTIANLFLDYCYGLPISNLSLKELLQLHHFAEYTDSQELYMDTLNALMDCISHANADLIVPVIFHAILTRDKSETWGRPLTTFVQYVKLTKAETQKTLFVMINDSANTNIQHLTVLGTFFYYGIGTPEDRKQAAEYFHKAGEVGEYTYLEMREEYVLIKKLCNLLNHLETPGAIQDFYTLLAKSNLQTRKAVKEFLHTYKPLYKELQAAIPFHLAIFFQEGIGVERDEEVSLSLLREAAGLGSVAAINYLAHHYPSTPILELYDIDVAFNTPEISLEDLEKLFDIILCNSSPIAEKNFYNALKRFNLQVQQEFRFRLRDNLKMAPDPYLTPSDKYHLGRFYFEGLGGDIKKRRGLELLKESAAFDNLRAARYLRKINPNIGQKSDRDLRESLSALRSSPLLETSFQSLNKSLATASSQVPRSFLPAHKAFNLQDGLMGTISEESRMLFLNFQLGLGLPADTSFEHLAELYRLAHGYEIKDLLQITTALILQAVDLNKKDLLPQLLDLVLLEEKSSLFPYSGHCYGCFLKHLKKANKETQKTLYEKLNSLEKNNPLVQILLGKCSEFGMGVSKNGEDARKFYLLAADTHSALAYESLGQYFQRLKQFDEAYRWFHLAASQKLRSSQASVAIFIQRGKGVPKNEQEGFKGLKEIADEGYGWAQDLVAQSYTEGSGVEVDLVKAFEYFKLAVSNGYHESLCYLADCYRKGQGVNKDQALAFYYYREAADAQDLPAFVQLARHYAEGKGVKQNTEKAIALLTEGVNKGCPEAQHKLGVAYYNGEMGLDISIPLAFRYFKLAAAQELDDAQYMVGLFNEKEFTPHACIEGAMSYYLLAAAQNNVQALIALGNIYQFGKPAIEVNTLLAYQYIKQAADLKSSVAQYNVGVYHEQNLIEGANMATAITYYQLAAAQGYDLAQQALADLAP